MLNTIRSTLPAGTPTPHFALESVIEQMPGYSWRWLVASDRLAPMAQITSPDGERLGVIVYINNEWLCHEYKQEGVI